MRLRKLGERELLAAIRRNFAVPRKDILLGIGDDAAVVKPGAGRLLVTKDLLAEDYDFILPFQDPRLLGRKSLNVNISDIAAMGGIPLYALLGLGLPRETGVGWVVEFFAGIKEAARTADVVLIGGDLSQSRKVLISVTVIGRASGRIILRSGARPGDRIFVSGFLGDAKQGFLLYSQGLRFGDDPAKDFFLKAFLDPQPQTSLGRDLSRLRAATALIDCSDGLSVDLNHICEASGTGAEIDLEKIPLSPAMLSFQKKPLPLALHGGEDYQLIFTIKPRDLARIGPLRSEYRLRDVGRITREKGIRTVDALGRRKVLAIKGFEHFK
jgi:thiamine-monophosphate kinase